MVRSRRQCIIVADCVLDSSPGWARLNLFLPAPCRTLHLLPCPKDSSRFACSHSFRLTLSSRVLHSRLKSYSASIEHGSVHANANQPGQRLIRISRSKCQIERPRCCAINGYRRTIGRGPALRCQDTMRMTFPQQAMQYFDSLNRELISYFPGSPTSATRATHARSVFKGLELNCL